MRSERQFFMTAEDESEFVSFAEKLVDEIDRQSDIQWFLCVGDCRIQLLRSYVKNGAIISGRISVVTTGLEPESKVGGERVYNQLRSWLKKFYCNEMKCRNINIDGSDTDIKTMWTSPRILNLYRDGAPPTLKQNPNGFVVFEPRNQAEQGADDQLPARSESKTE